MNTPVPWLMAMYHERMEMARGDVPVRSGTTWLYAPLVWARLEPAGALPGPWIGTNEGWAREQGFVVGTPVPGDLITPNDSNEVERLGEPT